MSDLDTISIVEENDAFIEEGNALENEPAQKDTAQNKPLTFEHKVERIGALLFANNLNRPVLYRILTTVEPGALPIFDLEDRVQAMPEFKIATQPPYFLIEWLVKAEALSFIEVDEAGQPVTEEQRAGKTEDEIDDMIADMLIEITDVGREALRIFSPSQRLQNLLAEFPERFDTYIEVLRFVTVKRSFNEIDQLLQGRPILMSGRQPNDIPMQPSVFVDKLAAAGGIIYDDGWIVTSEGKEMLERILSK